MVPEHPSWWFDELRHAGDEHLDPMYVAGYDEKSGTDWSDEVARLSALGIGSSSTVVDLGAGTGSFALAVAPHVGRVVAVDVSLAMVASMRSRGIDAVHAGFLTYEHEGEARDAVFTRNAQPMVERAGFDIRAREIHESRMYASYTCVRR